MVILCWAMEIISFFLFILSTFKKAAFYRHNLFPLRYILGFRDIKGHDYSFFFRLGSILHLSNLHYTKKDIPLPAFIYTIFTYYIIYQALYNFCSFTR